MKVVFDGEDEGGFKGDVGGRGCGEYLDWVVVCCVFCGGVGEF